MRFHLGGGGVKYISPAEQAKVAPKAKADSSKPRGSKSKAKPKQVEQASKKRGRSRAESASAAEVSKKKRRGSAAKKPATKESKRKNKGKEETPPAKSRKVDLNPKEALRSKKCCAYQKVLTRLRREGVEEDEAKKQAKLVARMQ